jgi:cytochrome c peroxidase
MTRKKMMVCATAVVVLGLTGGALSFVLRQIPRTVPSDPAAVRAAAIAVLDAKCTACHDSRKPLPFYAKLPGPGSLVRKDVREGIRHWDLYDVGHLGGAATEAEKAAEEVPLGRLIKLRRTVADGTMPPIQYRLAHWGTSLTVSERQILNAWVGHVWGAWLSGWGIVNGAGSDVHPLPQAIPFDAAKAALGERLYHDTRFSKDNSISCASCHAFEKGGTDNLPFSVGVGGLKGGVNAPTVFNAVFNMRQFWDGRARHLAEQAGGPPLNPVEMASKDWAEIIAKLEQDAAFKKAFTALYPEGFCEATLCDAIAEFERRLITPNSRFDRSLAGDKKALSEKETKGYAAFQEHRCASCHAGPALGGRSFEYADLKADYFAGREVTEGDQGLAAFSKNPQDAKRFKVPTLRNIALTAPYLHDGSKPDLKETVRSMMKHQVGAVVTETDLDDLTAFLGTLSGHLFGKPLAP